MSEISDGDVVTSKDQQACGVYWGVANMGEGEDARKTPNTPTEAQGSVTD